MQTAIVLINFFTLVVGLVLTFYVFSRGLKNPFIPAFATTMIGIVGWNLCIFLLIAHIGPTLAPGKLAFSFLALMVAGLVWFVSVYPTKAKLGMAISMLFGLAGLAFFIIPITNLFVTEVVIAPEGFITGDLHPVLFPAWFNFYFGSLLFVLIYLLIRTILAKGVQKLQLVQVLVGFTLFLMPMVITQLVLPRFFGDFRFNNLGPAFTMIMTAFLAHAIMRYRLL
ncbi:MAG: hypothetical protein O3B96_01550, partial [bacterium]|nr:hypothetical protein [bacterium]